ncbi:addiction module RelE/StbE family toxin [Dyella sp. SG562]|uniref:type II toxin-antitoxin system RelE/ParE family toxin n=1 Tax=unclassified Dyella TaxID=2634549 RepID=UPI00142486EF|nr:type II toxin-antitoxin system RelE/ParE family toxin [Dyella sp. SG562]NII74675.1 addiction module RelE/StbE family toxin [Dyella sp. SG562]
MAEVTPHAIRWTEPALAELDEIADYIALDDPQAAQALVQRIFDHVDQLAEHPNSGSKPPELKGWRYRQIIEPPCRVFYRVDEGEVVILYVMRSERLLKAAYLEGR